MTPDLFKKTFFRSFPLQACFCYERMQNVGFAYQMIPALKKLYPNKDEASEALKRHLAIFNTTPAIVTFITGAAIALEEKFKKAKEAGEECDEDSINAVKTALMGPLAGIGDSFFWGTFRIIGAGIGATMAANGSILGALLFLLIYNIPHLLIRYQGLKIGYKSGVNFLSSMSEGGIIAKLTDAAKILGLIVVGSMCASMVKLSTPLVFHIAGAEVVVQTIFDSIITGFLPLGLTLVTYNLLRKGMKTTTILWGMILIGILGSVFGIL
ncbi:MAG: PTS system mannose/fructose/sorbose family transporter subunit IID [Herbinix sp.]|nr:PTS system mannose/fructose/sorbose family transporter subunit IID [Herbinix sp.]